MFPRRLDGLVTECKRLRLEVESNSNLLQRNRMEFRRLAKEYTESPPSDDVMNGLSTFCVLPNPIGWLKFGMRLSRIESNRNIGSARLGSALLGRQEKSQIESTRRDAFTNNQHQQQQWENDKERRRRESKEKHNSVLDRRRKRKQKRTRDNNRTRKKWGRSTDANVFRLFLVGEFIMVSQLYFA